MERRSLIIFLAGLLGSFLCAGTGAQTVDCSQQSTCDQCIAASVNCVWCSDTIFNGSSRCYMKGDSSVRCTSLEDPRFEPVVTQFGTGQIRPQAVDVQLRTGESKTLDFTFQPGANFPLDVYFLMDLGSSTFGNDMLDDLRFFHSNLPDILAAIAAASVDNRVAFGTFVDKPVDTFVGSFSTPCVRDADCYAPHSFIHHVDFTNGSDFQTAFNQRFTLITGSTLTQSSTKANPFNSGLDAVVQVAECLGAINWRDTSKTRRVLIYISDSAFHLSSDAWIGGQALPHDGNCHLAPNPDLTNTGLENYFPNRLSDYYPARQQEYASPALVQNKLEKARIVPAFLVTANQKDVYENLVNALSQNNAASFELMSDSSNLVTLLQNLFSSLQANIRLSPEVVDGLRVEVNASCSSGDSPNSCTGVRQEELHTFTVKLTLERCTEALRNGVRLPVSDPFLGSTWIDVMAVCSCNCTTSSMAGDCNGRGTLTCGICDCNPGRYGPNCACLQEPSCPIEDGLECSGEGKCDECGICNCTDGFYGPNCNCSDISCGRGDNGLLCSGNGQCSCGQCICILGYTMRGDSPLCDCPMNQTTCIEPKAGTLCSERGSCVCGACECNQDYGGKQCQQCLELESCDLIDCQIHSKCVNCRYSIAADNSLDPRPPEECTAECGDTRVTEVTGADDTMIVTAVYDQCSMALGSCSLQYFIGVGENTIYVVKTPQGCALVIPAWAIALAVFIALLILGIVLLALVKLILYLLDFMEYKRFLKDIGKTQFGETENPIYRAPETQHPNPLFQGKTQEKSYSLSPTEKEVPVKFS